MKEAIAMVASHYIVLPLLLIVVCAYHSSGVPRRREFEKHRYLFHLLYHEFKGDLHLFKIRKVGLSYLYLITLRLDIIGLLRLCRSPELVILQNIPDENRVSILIDFSYIKYNYQDGYYIILDSDRNIPVGRFVIVSPDDATLLILKGELKKFDSYDTAATLLKLVVETIEAK